jgi:hypothetical protein
VTSENNTSYRNLSTSTSSIILEAGQFIGLGSGLTPFITEIGNLNGDSRPDLINAMFTSAEIDIIRNKLNEPYISNFNPSAASGNTVTITGVNFTGATAVIAVQKLCLLPLLKPCIYR